MGSGFKTFNSGDVLTAADVQNYLQDQAVMVFANATARDAAVTSPEDGMVCYLEDTKFLQLYEDAAWGNIIDSSGSPFGAGQQAIVTFTSSGSFTKASYPWAQYARVTVVGGGGAGGGANTVASGGSGGGGGGTAVKLVAISAMSASETVTVGAGGTGVAGTDGNDGGTSSFGTHCVATGGSGGLEDKDSTPAPGGFVGGAGGVGTTGDLLMAGNAGGHMWLVETGTDVSGYAGGGGASSFGGGGVGVVYPNSGGSLATQGADGAVPGAGGDGSLKLDTGTPTLPGGDGADGIVVLELT